MSLRQSLIHIAAAHLAYTESNLANWQSYRDQALQRYNEALALPEDEPAPEPEVEVQPDPIIEPTPEPQPALPARRVFDLSPLVAWIAGQGYCVPDTTWGLRVIGSDTPVFAPSSAGKLEWLFEHVFGAGKLQDLRWDGVWTVSLEADSQVEAIGILHHGGSEYTEVLASA